MKYSNNDGLTQTSADGDSKCGVLNTCMVDVLDDVYFSYSTSGLALEYHNGNLLVRGKDAIRYVKLGDLSNRIS